MSESNESYAVQPESSTPDCPSPIFGFAESMQLRSLQDQQLASSREQLKRSTNRLLQILELDAPSLMVFRELAILTQRIGAYQNSLLDVSSP